MDILIENCKILHVDTQLTTFFNTVDKRIELSAISRLAMLYAYSIGGLYRSLCQFAALWACVSVSLLPLWMTLQAGDLIPAALHKSILSHHLVVLGI